MPHPITFQGNWKKIMKIVYNSEVNQARNKMGGDSKPIVALESTIITHGMAYPKNIQVAQFIKILNKIKFFCCVFNKLKT